MAHSFNKLLSSTRLPAVKALLIQCGAMAIMVAILSFLKWQADWSLSLLSVLILQGALAAALSTRCGLDVWWPPIQFFFPLALAAMLAFQLPPVIYLVLFVCLLALYWTTFRTRVPYFPSRSGVWETVSDLLPMKHSLRFIDIGSGFGGLVLHLAKQHPDASFSGIELAPLPYLVSKLRVWLSARRGKFIYGDYHRLNFADFDVVFAYLSPAAMPALWQKARAEMRPGTLLFSYEFAIPGVSPEITTEPDERNATIYGWHL